MAVFTNQATLSYNGIVRNSNITTGEIIEALTVTKTALGLSYAPYDKVTYVVSIVNNGTSAYSGVTLTDDLGGYTFGTTTIYPLSYVDGSARLFINGASAPAPVITAGPPMTASGITIPANSNALLIYETDVTDFAPLISGSTIENTVTVSGGSLINPITASETVSVIDSPNLSITKSLSPAVVTDNGNLTYTFVIQNIGNEEAAATDNVTVTDTFDPILSNITVTLNGAVLTAGVDYTYDEATGSFATIPGRITLPAAAFSQDITTGAWITDPGTAVLTVTGTV